MNSFICSHCQKQISTNNLYGSNHRNHCPYCLWSLHKDEKWSGDRLSTCLGEMEPIGLTFKNEGVDKFTGIPKQGEILLIHHCKGCDKISINRIAADDKPEEILKIFEKLKTLDKNLKAKLDEEEIKILEDSDEEEIKTQLYGKN